MKDSLKPVIQCNCHPCEPPTPGRVSMAFSDPPPDCVEVCNPSGTLRMWVATTGLPQRVQIAPSLLYRGPNVLADEVVRLCRQAR